MIEQPTKNRVSSLYDNEALKFVIVFLVLFLLFNYGNKFLFSVVTPNTRYFNLFFSQHFNYIQLLRTSLISISAVILKLLGFTTMQNDTQILALNGIPCNINYSCLGLGVMSFWAAFIIAFPKAFKEKIRFLFIGLVTIFLLNIVRIVALIILTVDMHGNIKYLNSQHDTFNYVVYAVLLSMIYFWIKNHTPNSTKSIIN